jgi:hypothetical protein
MVSSFRQSAASRGARRRTSNVRKPQVEPMEPRALLSATAALRGAAPEVSGSLGVTRELAPDEARANVPDRSFLPETTVARGAKSSFIKQLKRDLKEISRQAAADPGSPINNLLNELKSVPIVIHPRPKTDTSNVTASTQPGQPAQVYWSPTDTSPYSDGASKIPAATLLHELTHAWEMYHGYDNGEVEAVRAENWLIWRLGGTQRTSYDGTPLPADQVIWPGAANPPAPPSGTDSSGTDSSGTDTSQNPPADTSPPTSTTDPEVLAAAYQGWLDAIASVLDAEAFIDGGSDLRTSGVGPEEPYAAARSLLGTSGQAGTDLQTANSLITQAAQEGEANNFTDVGNDFSQARIQINVAFRILGYGTEN